VRVAAVASRTAEQRRFRALLITASVGVLSGARALAVDSVALSSVTTYGTIHAGGVVAVISGDDDRDATAALQWRIAGGGSFQAAHALIRIDATRFVGSLFALAPATSYEVRVTLADPDGVTGGSPATAALATRADALPEPAGGTLYVAPTGDDGNAGTDPAHPLQTIQRAADLAHAGDLVSIAPGVYRESVSVPRSGTAGAPMVFRGSGPGAILDGADAAIAAGVAWSAVGGGLYSRVTGFATGHVVTDAGRLFRYDSLAALQALAAGAPGGFYFDGATLYVRFADDSAPSAHAMHVARLEDGFVIDGRAHVRIEDLEIRHYGAGDYGKGVYLRYASDCAVRRCRIHEVGSAGVWVKGGERNLIEENEIWDTSIVAWPWPETKGSSAENNAVSLTNDLGRGNVIRRNTIHGTFNGVGPCGDSAPPGAFTSETDVYDNVLFEHTDDAFEPEGWCANVRLWGNRVSDVHMAFAVAPAAPGPTWIVRNVVWRHGNTRTSQQDGYTASVLKINSGYADPVGPLLLYHNTVITDAPGTDAVALLNPGYSTFIRSRNNVLAGTQYVLYKVNPVVLDWDSDLLHTSDPSRFVRWEGASYATLASFQGATGQEPNGVAGDPDLVDPAGGDFRPACGSPLLDAGLALPGINDGFAGAAPDIGALEGAAAVVAVPVLAVPGIVAAGDAYTVSWSATSPLGSFQLQEADDAAFSAPTTFEVSATSRGFTHAVGAATTYHYRVRAVDDCSGTPSYSEWSSTAVTVVSPSCDVVLANLTVAAPQTFEACGVLSAGPSFAVVSPGAATLCAPQSVRLRNGVSVEPGARLTVAIDPTLAP
jgi:hypothetical protein